MIAAAPATAQDALKPVKLMTVKAASSDFTRIFFGQVVAKQTVDLAFQVSGQIVEFPAIEGQPVAKGRLIARLDLETFELARDQARIQKEEADKAAERLQKLSGSAVSRVTVDEAVTQASLAAIALRNAEYSLDRATLVAPFDALVATRNVANFTTINAGTPVVRIHDMSELRIEIDVPEILFQRAGQNADVELVAKFEASEEIFPLAVREFNAETSSVGQSYRITLGLAPPEGLNILPGSSVTVTATVKGEAGGVIIPASAIAAEADGSVSVMVFEPGDGDEGTIRKTPVELEPAADGTVRLLSGPAEGAEIVAAGAAALQDGQAVRRFTGFRN